MNKERWQLIERTYHSALEREGEARSAFLNEACAGDEDLRSEVEGLITHDGQASSFIESPALEVAAKWIAEDQVSSMVGRQLGSYKILSQLGAGGMGEVYLAEDTRLDRKVAIKFILARSAADEQAQRRLLREAQAAARLEHPNICAIYEVGQQDNISFIVMQYVEGETLTSRIQGKPLQLDDTLDLTIQIADALSAAHSQGVIHRDIKPQNIIINSHGQLKVLDFGLAKVIKRGELLDGEADTEVLLSAPGMIMGTPAYMSPEQVRGETLDARTDIFSFGSVLYEMVSGRHPFAEPSPGATLSAILTAEPEPLARYVSDVPDELQRIVRKALSKSKEKRYQGIKDVLIDLRDLKQNREFEAKLERSIGSGVRDEAPATERSESGGPAQAQTGPPDSLHTDETLEAHTTSSTRIVIGEIKRHKLGGSLTLTALIIAAVAAYSYFNRQPVLSEKDTILLADLDNKTKDEIFDGTLKKGLAVQLEQSPFLNVFPEARVRQTLKLMGRSPDERITGEIAREICERENIKALIASSIAPLGSHYVITLEAINGQSGEVPAREQVEADGKEQVLRALSQAATRLREKLGESLSSIRRFDKPLEVATTSSLEALKAYSQAEEHAVRGGFLEAIPALKRAVELDPKFASAHTLLAVIYFNMKQPRLAAEYAEKAYALRDRVSEYEKLRVASYYYGFVTGEEDKRIEVLEMQKQIYPRDFRAPAMLATVYDRLRQSEKAAAEAREAVRLNPDFAAAYRNLGLAFVQLNRFAEGKEVYERALQQKLDLMGFHTGLYEIAFVSGDRAAMQHQLDWASGKPDEHVALDWQSGAAAFAGEWRRAQDFARRAIDLAIRSDAKEEAARYAAEQALRAAVFGQFASAKVAAAQSVALERNQITLTRDALALAQCGEPSQVQSLIAELAKAHPKDTLLNGVWVPTIRAAMELQLGDTLQAIDLLQAASRYEAAADFWPPYLRGQAYLRLKSGREAAAEFQKILDHRGEDPLSALYPLAHLGLARASTLAGDVAGSRKAYQDFLALWKDADTDLPVLIEAKKEYERLK